MQTKDWVCNRNPQQKTMCLLFFNRKLALAFPCWPRQQQQQQQQQEHRPAEIYFKHMQNTFTMHFSVPIIYCVIVSLSLSQWTNWIKFAFRRKRKLVCLFLFFPQFRETSFWAVAMFLLYWPSLHFRLFSPSLSLSLSLYFSLCLQSFFLFGIFITRYFVATFTCVVNNLGGYRVSGDGAQARVGTFCVRVL